MHPVFSLLCLFLFSRLFLFFVLLLLRPPISTLTDTLFPYPSLSRSIPVGNRLELFIGTFVGAITFSGSVIAFGKLSGKYKFRLFQGAPVVFSGQHMRSEEHTSELQSLMRISYAVFCLKKKKNTRKTKNRTVKVCSYKSTTNYTE